MLKPDIFANIMDFFASQQPILSGEEEPSATNDTGAKGWDQEGLVLRGGAGAKGRGRC